MCAVSGGRLLQLTRRTCVVLLFETLPPPHSDFVVGLIVSF